MTRPGSGGNSLARTPPPGRHELALCWRPQSHRRSCRAPRGLSGLRGPARVSGCLARPPGLHSLLGTDVLALHGAAQHLAHTHAQPHVLKAQAQVLARDGEPCASLPRACLGEQLRRGRGWDTDAVRSGLSRAGRGGGRRAGAGGQSTLRILGSVQRLLPWRACIQAAGESAGQWGRREQRRSATHQPHSKRGSALRHRPQLSRRAGHLYRWAAGRDAVSSARPRPPNPRHPAQLTLDVLRVVDDEVAIPHHRQVHGQVTDIIALIGVLWAVGGRVVRSHAPPRLWGCRPLPRAVGQGLQLLLATSGTGPREWAWQESREALPVQNGISNLEPPEPHRAAHPPASEMAKLSHPVLPRPTTPPPKHTHTYKGLPSWWPESPLSRQAHPQQSREAHPPG